MYTCTKILLNFVLDRETQLSIRGSPADANDPKKEKDKISIAMDLLIMGVKFSEQRSGMRTLLTPKSYKFVDDL